MTASWRTWTDAQAARPAGRDRGLRGGAPLDGRSVALILMVLLAVAAAAGVLVASGSWYVAAGVAVAIPAAALLLAYPFAAVAVWLLTMPYFFGEPTTLNVSIIWVVHRLMVPGMLVLLGLYHALGIKRSQFRVAWFDVALAGFLALGLANILLLAEGDVVRMLVAFHDRIGVPICAFWLIRSVGPSDRDLRRLFWVALATVGIQLGVGILSWVAPGILPSEWLGRLGTRTVGTLSGPAPFTTTIVLFSLILLQGLRLDFPPLVRRLTIVVLVIAVSLVFLAFSRGSWLGAGLVVLGLVPLYPRAIIAGAAIGAVIVLTLSAGPLAQEFAYAQERLDDTDTVAARVVTNDAALRMVGERPLLGFGYGNFERYDEAFKEAAGGFALKLGSSAHHTYLALMAENGVPAILLYMAPVIGLGYRSIRAWPTLPRTGFADRRLLVMLWLALLDQFVVSNFMDMLHSNPWGTVIWWFTLGLIACVVARGATTRAGRSAPGR